MKEIHAKGLACPQPVILTKKAMDAGETHLIVYVDNQAAVENLKRLADSQGFSASVDGKAGDFTLELRRNGKAVPSKTPLPAQIACGNTGSWAVFIGRDIIGSGDRELGTNLMRMYFYTLTQTEDRPAAILFMNSGVRLPVSDEQIIAHLRTLQKAGVKVLVCGTCLNFYGLSEQLQAGTVSNMYDIVSEMGRHAKVITL